MTRSTTTIPFSSLHFVDSYPSLHQVEDRLKKFLRTLRHQKQDGELAEGKMDDAKMSNFYDLINDADRKRITRRAMLYLDRLVASTGMAHLSKEHKAKLTPLRGGLPVSRIETEHEADEIAAALHTEMPWMARATEEVWHGLRASVRDELPGARFNPLVLVGPPGIGKSHWARRLAHHLAMPTTMIEATGEPAMFSLVGSQKGWGSASPGKLLQTVLSERHAGPLVVIDEVEKVGDVQSNKGSRHTLTDALLPLLERMSAQTWECPYFQVQLDMSWTNWVMTANSRAGLPEPLQSRCVVLDLPELTFAELSTYARHQAAKRTLAAPALDAVLEAIENTAASPKALNLRMVNRMLDRAEMHSKRSVLH